MARRESNPGAGQLILFSPGENESPIDRQSLFRQNMDNIRNREWRNDTIGGELPGETDHTLTLGDVLRDEFPTKLTGLLRFWVGQSVEGIYVENSSEPEIVDRHTLLSAIKSLGEEIIHITELLDETADIALVPITADAAENLRARYSFIVLSISEKLYAPAFQFENSAPRESVTVLNEKLMANSFPWEALREWRRARSELVGMSALTFLETFPLDARATFSDIEI